MRIFVRNHLLTIIIEKSSWNINHFIIRQEVIHSWRTIGSSLRFSLRKCPPLQKRIFAPLLHFPLLLPCYPECSKVSFCCRRCPTCARRPGPLRRPHSWGRYKPLRATRRRPWCQRWTCPRFWSSSPKSTYSSGLRRFSQKWVRNCRTKVSLAPAARWTQLVLRPWSSSLSGRVPGWLSGWKFLGLGPTFRGPRWSAPGWALYPPLRELCRSGSGPPFRLEKSCVFWADHWDLSNKTNVRKGRNVLCD